MKTEAVMCDFCEEKHHVSNKDDYTMLLVTPGNNIHICEKCIDRCKEVTTMTRNKQNG